MEEAGKLAQPGKYRWRGLLHQGIDPVYEASYGTPGTPAWDNADNTGAWMSDHNPPVAVAAGKDVMVLAAGGCEAGWALIATDLDGKKLWGERKFQGIRDVAADDAFVYVGMGRDVGRVHLKTGKYAPFETRPEAQLTVPVADEHEEAALLGLAVSGERLAVALSGTNVVRFFDKKTMTKLTETPVPDVRDVAADAAGNLFAISGTTVVKLDAAQAAPIVRAGLEKPYALAVDADGRLWVTDRSTHQVRLFSKDGAPLREVGLKGGRTLAGKWEPDGLRNPAGIGWLKKPCFRNESASGRPKGNWSGTSSALRHMAVWAPVPTRLTRRVSSATAASSSSITTAIGPSLLRI
jgi:hypothetical protein